MFWPKTSDGRVLFAIPWLGKTLVGTTDSRRGEAAWEPDPLPGEIDYLLRECAGFFARPHGTMHRVGRGPRQLYPIDEGGEDTFASHTGAAHLAIVDIDIQDCHGRSANMIAGR